MRGRSERKRSRSRSGRSRRGWRRDGGRRLSERGRPGRTGEAGGTGRRPEPEVAPGLTVPGSLEVEGGETGRGRRRTSGDLSLGGDQTAMTDVVTLPGVAHPGVAHPGGVHLHPRRAAVAPGGGRDPTGQTGLHQGVMEEEEEEDREPGDRAETGLEVPEILAKEDLLPGEMVVTVVMVVMVPLDALLTVMFGGVVEQVEEVTIGLHHAEEDVIATLVLEEAEGVIATSDLAVPLPPAVTPRGPETTDPPTGAKVRLVVKSGGRHSQLEMRERDPERDQPGNQRTAGPKSSVDQFPLITIFGEKFFLQWRFLQILH